MSRRCRYTPAATNPLDVFAHSPGYDATATAGLVAFMLAGARTVTAADLSRWAAGLALPPLATRARPLPTEHKRSSLERKPPPPSLTDDTRAFELATEVSS